MALKPDIIYEEGHYANKCPNKERINKERKEKIKLLEYVYSQQLEPIEENELSDCEQLYHLETDSEYETESDYETSDSE